MLGRDGYVTVRGTSDIGGSFDVEVPGDAIAPVEVLFRYAGREYVRPMKALGPAFLGSDDPLPVRENIVLAEVPGAAPGHEEQDRERYVYTLLDRIAHPGSKEVVRESEAQLRDWIAGTARTRRTAPTTRISNGRRGSSMSSPRVSRTRRRHRTIPGSSPSTSPRATRSPAAWSS